MLALISWVCAVGEVHPDLWVRIVYLFWDESPPIASHHHPPSFKRERERSLSRIHYKLTTTPVCALKLGFPLSESLREVTDIHSYGVRKSLPPKPNLQRVLTFVFIQ